jgi:hypothetical protein
VFKVSYKNNPKVLYAVKKIPLERFNKQTLREIQIFPIVQLIHKKYASSHLDA